MIDYTLTPARGRDYRSKKAVIADLEAQKDFLIQPEGRYCNLASFPKGTVLKIRYQKIRKVMIYVKK